MSKTTTTTDRPADTGKKPPFERQGPQQCPGTEAAMHPKVDHGEQSDQAPYLLDYASTKSAIVGFTKGLARMVAKRGVRVNAVAPGPVWTPLIPSTMPEQHVKEFGKSSVFGRPAQPAELAPLYVFLASDQAGYMTGEVVAATGGRTPF